MKNKKVLIAALVMSSILSTSTSILAVDEQTNSNTINVVENQATITTAYEELKRKSRLLRRGFIPLSGLGR